LLQFRRFLSCGEVRGLGLMVALDIHQDGKTAPGLRDELVQAAFRRGLLLLGCGESAIRFCPPLCISAEQISTALAILANVLADGKSMKKTG